MSPLGSAVLVTLLGLPGPEGPPNSAADAVTLRDGAVVLGEWIESSPRAGTTNFLVRREWARGHVPVWAKKWEATEAPIVRRAAARRRERLEAWARERRAGFDDRISSWINREVARLKNEGEATSSPLLMARLSRGDVRTISRVPAGQSRRLRLAWLSGFRDPEAMSADELKESLEGRGFDVAGKSPVSVDALVAPQPETDAAWLIRRAATEVSFDSDLRFVRYGAAVFPEPAAGQPMNLGGLLPAVSALKELLGENPGDPLAPRLREVEARGRVGALVTKLDTVADLSAVTVEMTLWVRQPGDRWVPGGSRSARVRTDDLGPDAGKDLADDPQVSMVFQAVEALGLGGIDPEVKRRSLGIGAATRKALGLARAAAATDLATLALPVLDAVKEPPAKEAPP